jgi:hypothetical protein
MPCSPPESNIFMESKMRSSRLGVVVLIACAVMLTTNCSYYSRVMSRKNLVDGSTAYKARKFADAEQLFRAAAARDPEGSTLEGRTAQLFLARTLHQRFSAARNETQFAEQAIVEYNKVVPQFTREFAEAKTAYDANPTGVAEQKRYFSALTAVNSSASAISSLNDALKKHDVAKEWQQTLAAGEQYPGTTRARAIVSLGLENNSCANDITNNDKVKKTVKVDGKDVFQFTKPENPEDLTKLQKCVADGTKLFDQAFGLENDVVKTAPTVDIKSLTDDQLAIFEESILPFESARSYRASIAVQAARLAEMEGSGTLAAAKAEAEKRKADSDQLKKVVSAIKGEKDARIAAAQAAAEAALTGGNVNANAPK